jgi:hypothetical protein
MQSVVNKEGEKVKAESGTDDDDEEEALFYLARPIIHRL